MVTNTTQRNTRERGARSSARRLAFAGTVTLATVAVLTAGPAHARVETPQDTAGQVPRSAVAPTRVAGLVGIHVDGGWLLR